MVARATMSLVAMKRASRSGVRASRDLVADSAEFAE